MVRWLSNSTRRRWWGCVVRRIAGGDLILHTTSVQSAARSACFRPSSLSPSFSASVFFLSCPSSTLQRPLKCFARVAAAQRKDGRRLWRLPYDQIFIVFQWSGTPLSCFVWFVCVFVCVSFYVGVSCYSMLFSKREISEQKLLIFKTIKNY